MDLPRRDRGLQARSRDRDPDGACRISGRLRRRARHRHHGRFLDGESRTASVPERTRVHSLAAAHAENVILSTAAVRAGRDRSWGESQDQRDHRPRGTQERATQGPGHTAEVAMPTIAERRDFRTGGSGDKHEAYQTWGREADNPEMERLRQQAGAFGGQYGQALGQQQGVFQDYATMAAGGGPSLAQSQLQAGINAANAAATQGAMQARGGNAAGA